MLTLLRIWLPLICNLTRISRIFLSICSKADWMVTRILRRQIWIVLSIKVNTKRVRTLRNFRFLLIQIRSMFITTTAWSFLDMLSSKISIVIFSLVSHSIILILNFWILLIIIGERKLLIILKILIFWVIWVLKLILIILWYHLREIKIVFCF